MSLFICYSNAGDAYNNKSKIYCNMVTFTNALKGGISFFNFLIFYCSVITTQTSQSKQKEYNFVCFFPTLTSWVSISSSHHSSFYIHYCQQVGKEYWCARSVDPTGFNAVMETQQLKGPRKWSALLHVQPLRFYLGPLLLETWFQLDKFQF